LSAGTITESISRITHTSSSNHLLISCTCWQWLTSTQYTTISLIAKTWQLIWTGVGVIKAIKTTERNWNKNLVEPTDASSLISVRLSASWTHGAYTIIESIARKTHTPSSSILLIHWTWCWWDTITIHRVISIVTVAA
jgi:hypothetical protein